MGLTSLAKASRRSAACGRVTVDDAREEPRAPRSQRAPRACQRRHVRHHQPNNVIVVVLPPSSRSPRLQSFRRRWLAIVIADVEDDLLLAGARIDADGLSSSSHDAAIGPFALSAAFTIRAKAATAGIIRVRKMILTVSCASFNGARSASTFRRPCHRPLFFQSGVRAVCGPIQEASGVERRMERSRTRRPPK